ncbi:MAG: hypothetical protein A3C88_00875 [Candidatus Yanofskybacteria bacterium RIFCSPHIGHO2_02_FULL_50_12]|uniref:Uncharacterized protein n=1 Tax=Candidatus Yanofskybacteria bacterium RIFCSPHIGHO2_02_FULL_50_12 TaxID=1802685 RepID=A0A1F8FVG0_9BACT|nr:MAG: hypothetical protein A3C88_00875 [Candidatus Yanofskybacteria bacterium RIFCSPHIGHO2_02_FULL_50_12]
MIQEVLFMPCHKNELKIQADLFEKAQIARRDSNLVMWATLMITAAIVSMLIIELTDSSWFQLALFMGLVVLNAVAAAVWSRRNEKAYQWSIKNLKLERFSAA